MVAVFLSIIETRVPCESSLALKFVSSYRSGPLRFVFWFFSLSVGLDSTANMREHIHAYVSLCGRCHRAIPRCALLFFPFLSCALLFFHGGGVLRANGSRPVTLRVSALYVGSPSHRTYASRVSFKHIFFTQGNRAFDLSCFSLSRRVVFHVSFSTRTLLRKKGI